MVEKLDYTDMIVDRSHPPIGYITLNRPERRNSLSTKAGGTIEQLQQACFEMRDDPEVRVFVIKGAGDCFCSGFYQAPASETSILKPPEELPKSVEWVRAVRDEPWARYGRGRGGDLSSPEGQSVGPRGMFREALWNNPKPSIAQVDSYCLGAGLWIANECDVVYATPNAVFSYPPIRRGASVVLGIIPPWLLGRRQSMWLALTGQAIDAQEAYNCGLITKIVPEDKIEEEVNKVAISIARVPPVTNMFSKRAVNNYYEGLGIQQAERFGGALVEMTENSAAPGHYFDYYAKIDKLGFREALKVQLETYGGFDDVQERERARLKAKKA